MCCSAQRSFCRSKKCGVVVCICCADEFGHVCSVGSGVGCLGALFAAEEEEDEESEQGE
jgi:hypothetical protein